MEAPTVYSPNASDYTFTEPDTPSLPLGKEYKLKMVSMNGIDIAAFNVDGEDLLCFPQVYEYFLKDLVSGMHTVYTKLKRMNIQGRNCNVEQVRIMRSVGAIGQVVNRCKLISREDFNKIYEDCLLYRGPGRRKKNPDIPPELLNNPFKHYKVDHSNNDHDLTSDPVAMDTNDAAKQSGTSLTPSNHAAFSTKDEPHNSNGESDSAFKVPMSQHVSSPRHASPHVIHANASHSRISSSPFSVTGNYGSPSTHSGTFSFTPRTTSSLSNLPTMVNIRSHMPPPTTNSALSPVIQSTYSPVRTSAGEVMVIEPSVSHVSSTGTSEHVDHRGNVTSDAGSDMSASSPRITSREMEYREPGSVETLLFNIQGLLKVAAENATQQQRQAYIEKEDLRRQLQREREAREKSERLCTTLQRGKAFWQKKLKREKKAKRKLNEKLLEEQQRCLLLEQQVRSSSNDAMKQLNDSLIQELDRERSAKGEAERKLKEARGEIQNFMQNFLENPGNAHSQQKPTELDQEQRNNVKEEVMTAH